MLTQTSFLSIATFSLPSDLGLPTMIRVVLLVADGQNRYGQLVSNFI